MNSPDTENLTELLAAWSDGDELAFERLAPLVHAELHRLARNYMSRERENHVLQTSALINAPSCPQLYEPRAREPRPSDFRAD
jgi:hypothetical protein